MAPRKGTSNGSDGVGEKCVVSFDLKGNPIGPNKAAFKKRSLELAKVIVGVTYESWKLVPEAKRDDLWDSLSQSFILPSEHKGSVLSQAADQIRSWKKNLRKAYFGVTRQSILKLKDNKPVKVEIPLASWNHFVEHEASTAKIDQRDQSKINRKKKTDVHLLGSKSYAQLEAEWQETTKGTEEEGLEPNRVNLYLHARKDKEGNFHKSVKADAETIKEIRDGQDEASQSNIELDALTEFHGKDNRGRVRGVGRVSRTKLMHIKPLISELQQVKEDVKTQNVTLENMKSNLDTMGSQVGTMLNMMQNQDPTKFSFPVVAITEPSQTQVMNLPTPKQLSPPNIGACSYMVKDLTNTKRIAIGKIINSSPGTIVHGVALKDQEVKLAIENIFSGMENEPLYRPGFAETIGECKDSFVAWPIHLLEKLA